MKWKNVWRWSQEERVFRIGRLLWERGPAWTPAGSGWNSNKLSVAIEPRWFVFRRELRGWWLTLCGLRLHKQKDYGGRIV